MEPNFSESSGQQDGLRLSNNETTYLNEAAMWARFLGIVGFVGCGMLVIFSFFAKTLFASLSSVEGAQIPEGMGGMLAFVYLMIAAIYFFPCYYLYNFGMKMKHALVNHDQQMLQHSFANLKSCFKFFGIFTVIILALYAVVIIAMVLGASIFS